MDSFSILPCTIADGPAMGRNNVQAFWTDQTWTQVWRGLTREYVAEQAAKRGRRNLLLDRDHRRHLKAVDNSTGALVGYARWVLPHAVIEGSTAGGGGGGEDPCRGLWAEARIPDVGEDVRREAEREGEGADWDVERSGMYGIDEPITTMEAELVKGKRYMGMLPCVMCLEQKVSRLTVWLSTCEIGPC